MRRYGIELFHRVLTLLLVSLTATGLLQARLATGTTDSSDAGALFIQAINADSVGIRHRIVENIFSQSTLKDPGIARILSSFERLHRDYAPLVYHHSETMPPRPEPGVRRVLHVYARESGASMWKDFQIILDDAPPYRIRSLAFIAEVAEPVYLPNGDIHQPATLHWLEEYVDKLVKENDLSGSILIARGDAVLFERYFGFADLSRRTPVDSATLFNLGSGNKMFTALSVARLVEEGKLRYTDQLSAFLPDHPDGRAGKVTIHHLLSHTSGIGEYWTEATRERMLRCTRLEDYLPIIYEAGFDFDPGTAYGYSNSNFILLGLILEKVTGMKHADIARKFILEKAGMIRTGFYRADAKEDVRAERLSRSDIGWAANNNGDSRSIIGSSAGGAYSSCREILLFSRALKNHSLVTPATLSLVTASKTSGMKDAESYGYGMILQKWGGIDSWGHGGIAPGVNFEFRYFPDLDITLVVFSNQDNGAYDDLKKNSLRLISGVR